MKIAAVIATVLLATPAAAETITLVPTCVESDSDDRILLVRTLEKRELLIVEAGCTETLKVSRVDRVVRLDSERRSIEEQIEPGDDMSAVYARMVEALFEPVREVEQPIPQTSAYRYEPTEAEEKIENTIWYTRLGFGSDTMWFGGLRVGRSAVFDLSVAVGDRAALRAQLLRTSSPESSSSMYWGGGVALASGATSGEMETSGGVQLETTLGFEVGRTSSVRWYFEVNGSVPLFDHPATAVFSFGLGK